MKTWYFLDEDCNRRLPKDEKGTVQSCCDRCHKRIKVQASLEKVSFSRIALHPNEPYFRKLVPLERLAPGEIEGMIGDDCWKAVQKFGAFVEIPESEREPFPRNLRFKQLTQINP